MDDYRIGLTGSRNWKMYGVIERALRYTAFDAQQRGLRPVLVVGDCPTGADWIATRTWLSWKWEPEVFYADWDNCVLGACPKTEHRRVKKHNDKHHPGALETYCPKAGPRRNVALVASGLDTLLAFPMDGPMRSGTWHCINVARGRGLEPVLPDRWQ